MVPNPERSWEGRLLFLLRAEKGGKNVRGASLRERPKIGCNVCCDMFDSYNCRVVLTKECEVGYVRNIKLKAIGCF